MTGLAALDDREAHAAALFFGLPIFSDGLAVLGKEGFSQVVKGVLLDMTVLLIDPKDAHALTRARVDGIDQAQEAAGIAGAWIGPKERQAGDQGLLHGVPAR